GSVRPSRSPGARDDVAVLCVDDRRRRVFHRGVPEESPLYRPSNAGNHVLRRRLGSGVSTGIWHRAIVERSGHLRKTVAYKGGKQWSTSQSTSTRRVKAAGTLCNPAAAWLENSRAASARSTI